MSQYCCLLPWLFASLICLFVGIWGARSERQQASSDGGKGKAIADTLIGLGVVGFVSWLVVVIFI